MKIAVPSDDGNTLASHTGRAQGFIIYQADADKVVRLEYRRNQYTAHVQGLHPKDADDASHHHDYHNHSHAPLLDALNECKIVIAHGMGSRLQKDLASVSIETVFTLETDADQAAGLFASGKLETAASNGCNRHR